MKTPKNSNLSEPVYNYLRDMILNLEIKPGEKIPELRIAEKFSISRTPIREALRRLANEGLINIYPNRFAEVVTFDDEYIKNMGIIRLALDTTAIKLAIYYGSNADFERLRALADGCYEASQRSDRQTQNRMDVAFHMEISNISRNPFIQKYHSQIFLQLELLLNWKYGQAGGPMKTHTHFDLVEAMMARDQQRAVKIITEHLTDFYKFEQALAFLL